MEWIKKSPEQFALAVVATALLVVSSLLILKTRSFGGVFEAVRGQVAKNNSIDLVDRSALDKAQAMLQKPQVWNAGKGSLLVSEKYVVINDRLVNPQKSGEEIHKGVPNQWFYDNGLDILATDVLSEDPDGDGFSNQDEFLGKTNPQDKNAHPPYLSKLRFVSLDLKRFRLLFAARPDATTFQINTIDLRQPSQYLKLGDPIKGTKFKIVKFEEKFVLNNLGIKTDVSEVTIENQETGESLVLVLGKQADSPDSFAEFSFLWDKSALRVKKDQKFSLKPQPDLEYKLIDIKPAEALIENLKTGEKITLPRSEAANG